MEAAVLTEINRARLRARSVTNHIVKPAYSMDEKYHPKNFGFVYVSNSVILDRRKVVAMFRKQPEPNVPFSGWCFVCDERGDPKDIDLYSVERLLSADPSVAPFLDAPVGSRFLRSEDGTFEPDIEEDECEGMA